jgi:hypothetical protein
MIQRQVKKRLGYNGIEEILGHQWMRMGNRQFQEFYENKFPSPIIPLQVSLHQSLQQVTEPNEVWRENILLLKKQETQSKMFEI